MALHNLAHSRLNLLNLSFHGIVQYMAKFFDKHQFSVKLFHSDLECYLISYIVLIFEGSSFNLLHTQARLGLLNLHSDFSVFMIYW